MIEVDYGGGGHHTWLREINDQLVCSRVPLPPYIKEQGGRPAGAVGRARRRSPPPSRSRTPLFPTPTRRGKGRGRGRRKGGRRPPLLVQFGPGGRRRAAHPGCPSLSPLRPIWPITSPGGVPVTLRHSGFLRNHPEHFRCPNIVVQYIDLYVSTISRLLVMSPISSGTPNSFGTSKLNKTVIVTLSVRTLRVRELCRHDRDTSPVNNQ